MQITQMRHMRMTAVVSVGMLVGITAVLSAQQPTITRTVLQRADMACHGHEAVTAKAEFPAGGATGKHTHPGEEVSYVVAGTLTLEVAGAPMRTIKAGDVFLIPASTVHNATAVGGAATVIANYLVEKGKPMTTAVP